ncbi:hypothetical protein NBRC116494_34500 [Aurantivibrio plasticivorans]
MSDEKFDIVFRGDIVLGHTLPEVKQRLAQLFKIELAKVDALFTGKAVPLKRNLDKVSAEKYKAALVKAGAQVSVKASNASAAPAPARPRPAAKPVGSMASPSEQKPIKAMTMKERLELQAAQDAAKEAAKKAQQEARAEALENSQPEGAEGLSLAPVGSLLVKPKAPEQPPVLKIDGMTLRPAQGDLLDASEKPSPVAAQVEVAGYDLADVGADLLAPGERAEEPEITIDFSDFDLAEVGADLLLAAERHEVPPVAVANSDFELAPVGADLGEKRKTAPPPPPDTSNLSLDPNP